MTSFQAKDSFAKEVAKNEPNLNLARAALLLAGYITQTGETPTYYLTLLDDMAEAVRPAIAPAPTAAVAALESLNHYLFTELGFAGNRDDYYNPNNSFLNQVLDVRTGIPISLSLIYLEVGWRLGLPLHGVGLPGHFIVGYTLPQAALYIDVFNGGRILSEDECLALSTIPLTNRAAFRQNYLLPVSKKAMLFRMLLNLKQIYLQHEAWELAHRTLDLMLIVRPAQSDEFRDRGLVALRLQRWHEAAFDLRRYLFLTPNAPDLVELKQHLDMLEERLNRLN
ncbi:MAG: transglutaminase-like domain-containing protein [Anaerolineae bacterium]